MALGSTVVAGELPPQFNARYQVEMGGMTLGEVSVALQFTDGKYHYSKKTKTKGLVSFFRRDTITETSSGAVNGSDLSVLSYQYVHKKRKQTKQSNIDFSVDGIASGSRRDQAFKIDTPKNVFDRASVELALMRDSGARQLTYHVVQKGQLAHYTFRSKGKKNYTLPAGDFSCQEYEVERSTGNRRTTICLSERLKNLPVRATHDEKGKIITMSLVSVQFSDQ